MLSDSRVHMCHTVQEACGTRAGIEIVEHRWPTRLKGRERVRVRSIEVVGASRVARGREGVATQLDAK